MGIVKNLYEDDAGEVLSVSFEDANANALTPTTIHYRIYCETTDTLIRDYTSVTPSSTASITLTSDDTAIIDADNDIETRKVTVVSDRGTSSQKTDEYFIQILNVASR